MVLFNQVVHGQDLKKVAEFKLSIPNPYIFEIDNLGFIYLVYPNGIIEKRNQSGEILYVLNNKSKGRISRLDVGNPLKINVHYPDINSVLLIDNTLSPIKTIDFINYGVTQASTSCLSRNGGIWFFDGSSFTISKIDNTGKLTFTSQLLSNKLQDFPNYMIESGQSLMLSDGFNILEFDALGTFIKKHPIDSISSFQLNKDLIMFYKQNNFYSYSRISLIENKLPLYVELEKTNINEAKFFEQKLFVLSKNQLDIYKIL